MSDRALRNVAAAVVAALFGATLALVLDACDPPHPIPSSGYRVTSPAEGRVLTWWTSTTSPAERIAPTPPASVPRGETTSTTAGDVAELGTFRVTCYGPPLFPAGQTTASGAPVGPGSIAVDPAVIRLGTGLEVEGYGRGVANDRGSKVRGRHVDVWRADPYNDCPVRSARVRVISS